MRPLPKLSRGVGGGEKTHPTPVQALGAHLPANAEGQAARLGGSREPPPTGADQHVLEPSRRRGSCNLHRPNARPGSPAPFLRGQPPRAPPPRRGRAAAPEATPPAPKRLRSRHVTRAPLWGCAPSWFSLGGGKVPGFYPAGGGSQVTGVLPTFCPLPVNSPLFRV